MLRFRSFSLLKLLLDKGFSRFSRLLSKLGRTERNTSAPNQEQTARHEVWSPLTADASSSQTRTSSRLCVGRYGTSIDHSGGIIVGFYRKTAPKQPRSNSSVSLARARAFAHVEECGSVQGGREQGEVDLPRKTFALRDYAQAGGEN